MPIDGCGCPSTEREVDALRRPFGELLDERAAGPRRQREQHHARGVAIDAVDDERLAPAVRAVALLEEIEHRRPVGTGRCHRRGVVERHGQHPGRLVDDDQRVVLEERFQAVTGPRRGAARRRSRPIDPQADDLARGHQLARRPRRPSRRRRRRRARAPARRRRGCASRHGRRRRGTCRAADPPRRSRRSRSGRARARRAMSQTVNPMRLQEWRS